MIHILSKERYVPLQTIRFLRIPNDINKTIYLKLYFSHKNKKDNYYCILYNPQINTRYLLYSINNEMIVWQE